MKYKFNEGDIWVALNESFKDREYGFLIVAVSMDYIVAMNLACCETSE